MADEFEVCTAAFFRSKGKDVVTEEEFYMEISLGLKWMSHADSKLLKKALVEKGILVCSNGLLRPARDLGEVQVPLMYKPSAELKKSLSGTSEKPVPKAPAKKTVPEEGDIFVEMIGIAEANGLQKGKFVSESNILKKKLGVDTCVAALILLRDAGVDTEGLDDRVYAQVSR